MRCPYPRCDREMELGEQFCFWCGTNAFPRAPAPKPGTCDHHFRVEGPFCTLCGFDSDAPLGLQPHQRLPAGLGMCLLVVVGLAVLGYLNATTKDKGMARTVSYLIWPAIALLVYATRFLVPRRWERTI